MNLHINGHAKDLPHNKSEDELDDDDDRLTDDERDEGKVDESNGVMVDERVDKS